MTRDGLNRILRSVLQAGAAGTLITTVFAMLKAFGVPVTPSMATSVTAFVSALLTLVVIVTAWNATEDATGKAVLRRVPPKNKPRQRSIPPPPELGGPDPRQTNP